MLFLVCLLFLWGALVSYLLVEDNVFLAILIYFIGVCVLCSVLSEVLGFLVDCFITWNHGHPQAEAIIEEVIIVEPYEKEEVPTNPGVESTTSPEIVVEVVEEVVEEPQGPIIPLGFTSLWLLSIFIS